MRAKRVDANHAQIRDGLRAVLGDRVKDTSWIGHGWPDLVVAFKGRLHMVEVKRPGPKSARTLTDAEHEFQAWCHANGLEYHVAQSLDEALAALGLSVERAA